MFQHNTDRAKFSVAVCVAGWLVTSTTSSNFWSIHLPADRLDNKTELEFFDNNSEQPTAGKKGTRQRQPVLVALVVVGVVAVKVKQTNTENE